MHRTLILLGLLLIGCTSAPAAGPLASNPASQSLPQAAPTLTALSPAPDANQPPADSTQLEQPTAESASTQEMTVQNGAWQVTLFSPGEVDTSAQPYELKGAAPVGTVVSINEQVLVVDGSGAFSVLIPLDEGPNLVQVIASSPDGEEADFLLTITFSP